MARNTTESSLLGVWPHSSAEHQRVGALISMSARNSARMALEKQKLGNMQRMGKCPSC